MAVIASAIKIGSWRGEFGKDGRVSFTLHVETDDTHDGPFVVESSRLVPRIGTFYAVGNEISPTYICRKVKPKIDPKDKKLWEVEVEYEAIEGEDEKDEDNEEDPRPSKRFRFSSSFRFERRPMLQDLDGKFVRNTAGEDYTKPLERNMKILVFSIERTEYSNPIVRQTKYMDSVNKFKFWGQDPGYVLIESYLTNGEGKGNLTTGWEVKYTIAIRPKSGGRWDETEIPSMGFNEKVYETNEDPPTGMSKSLKPIINKATGKAYTVEQYLDLYGRWSDRLAANFAPHNTKYRVREKYDFRSLRLPDMRTLTYSAQLDQDEERS